MRGDRDPCDLWVDTEEINEVLREAGVEDAVTAGIAAVRHLRFQNDEFDAIVSIDAFEYFGTDDFISYRYCFAS